jgi:GTPase Era involved in 16S rRNA processing
VTEESLGEKVVLHVEVRVSDKWTYRNQAIQVKNMSVQRS